MKLPYDYVLNDEEIVIHQERADSVRDIFERYLAGASLGKIVDMLFTKGIPFPDREPQMDQGSCRQTPCQQEIYSNRWHKSILGCSIRKESSV